MLNFLSNNVGKVIAIVSGTVIVGLLITVFFLFNDTKKTTGELATSNAANVILKQNETYVEESRKIDDQTVKEFVIKKDESKTSTAKLRSESINEYTSKIKDPVPTPVPQAMPDGNDRVGVLADRMLELYCSARPKDAGCNPQHSAN